MNPWLSFVIGIVFGISLTIGIGILILSIDDRRKNLRSFGKEKVFETEAQANEILSIMTDILEEYKVVTVGDFLELVGMQSEYTDQYYGWKSLKKSKVVKVKYGYMLDLPELKSLKL